MEARGVSGARVGTVTALTSFPLLLKRQKGPVQRSGAGVAVGGAQGWNVSAAAGDLSCPLHAQA